MTGISPYLHYRSLWVYLLNTRAITHQAIFKRDHEYHHPEPNGMNLLIKDYSLV